MEQNHTTPQVLIEKDAARFIGYSVAFLRADRMNGPRRSRTAGPPFVKIGRSVRYLKNDLDAWLQEHRIDRRKSAEGGGK